MREREREGPGEDEGERVLGSWGAVMSLRASQPPSLMGRNMELRCPILPRTVAGAHDDCHHHQTADINGAEVWCGVVGCGVCNREWDGRAQVASQSLTLTLTLTLTLGLQHQTKDLSLQSLSPHPLAAKFSRLAASRQCRDPCRGCVVAFLFSSGRLGAP